MDTLSNHAALSIARQLAADFAHTAAERDLAGGTPLAERKALRDSGLLALSIPTRFGGQGARWQDTFAVVRTFAQAGSPLAHVFGFHHLIWPPGACSHGPGSGIPGSSGRRGRTGSGATP